MGARKGVLLLLLVASSDVLWSFTHVYQCFFCIFAINYSLMADSDNAKAGGAMVLRAENLIKRYGKRTVVNNVSINVHQGEIEIGRASCRERV